jgi:uncharacterized protein (DUF2461 family)
MISPVSDFAGFRPGVRKWFLGLEADNSREYFASNRDFFEESIRAQMEALLTELGEQFGGEVKMFRQNRAIRFSADKALETLGIRKGGPISRTAIRRRNYILALIA